MSTMLRVWAQTAKAQATRASILSLTFAGAMAMPTVAHAQDKKDCEPGSWFCGETQQGKDLQPLPADKPAEAKPETKPAPPVVVYQPPPATVVVQAREAPPAYYYVPKKPPSKKEWGLNLHAGGAMLGRQSSGNSGMGLAGVGLRFRPIPYAALETDVDFAAGRDYYGFRRTETALSFNAVVFVNPKSVVQLYFIGGFGWSWARAVDDTRGFDASERNYAYLGFQTGVGLEFRLSKHVALNFDVRGLIRGRIDEDRYDRVYRPEFVSADGRATNTSGAGLLQGGLTFYW